MTCALPRGPCWRSFWSSTKKRPIHIGDLKEAFNVVEKKDVARFRGWRKTDKIEYALRKFFRKVYGNAVSVMFLKSDMKMSLLKSQTPEYHGNAKNP